jgi:hypothetical protein
VGADQDLLFGKIAVNRKYCTRRSSTKCIALQAQPRPRAARPDPRSEGYITEDQHSEILAIQRRNLTAIDPVSKLSKESILIGKLAVRGTYMTERDVNTLPPPPGQGREKRSIGEIMVEQGYLSPGAAQAAARQAAQAHHELRHVQALVHGLSTTQARSSPARAARGR